MKFPVWCEVVCGGCSATLPGRYAVTCRIPVREISKQLKAHDWITHNGECYCSDACRKRFGTLEYTALAN